MSKKVILLALVLAFGLMSSVHAATIVWVSDNKTPSGGVPADQGWVDMLTARGYTVNLDFRNQEGRTLDAAKIATLNAADLIIVGRDTDSGSYDDGSEPTQWNSVTTPIILTVAHIARNNRWLWLNTDATNDAHQNFEVVEPGHPIFAGLSLGAGDQLDILTMGSSFANTTSAGNGTLIARRADNDQVWIVEWQAGQEYYSGSGQTAAGPRLYFVCGSDEGTDGRYNLTADGEQMFINAVNYMLGGLRRATAYGPDPADESLYLYTWVNLSWKPGGYAVSHDVYLGDDFDDVSNGTGGTFLDNTADVFLTVGIKGYPYPDGFVPGTTYYWRVDEVNDLDPNSPWKGEIWSFTVPSKKAYEPVPADGARFIDPDVTLSWTGGLDVMLHHMYFGDNAADVAAGTPDTDKENVPATSFVPGTLEQDKTYYWRVDEFDTSSATHTGDVWSFKTMPEIAVSDPNLVAWWKLDEGQGTAALDWSGHGNHGVLQGDPQWAEGYDGDAMDLDGDDDHLYVASVQLPTSAFTIAFWFNSETGLNQSSAREDFIYWQSVSRPHMTFNKAGNGEIGLWPNIGGDFDGPLTMTTSWSAGTWYHIAGTFDGTNFRIHVNGNVERSVSHPGEHEATTGLFIGCTSSNATNFNGMIDDVRIYDYALSDAEIKEAMRGDPLLAWSPKPSNGSTPGVKDTLPLSWSAGDKASQHYVYFGTDRNAVADADTSDTMGIYRGLQGAASYTPPEGVEWGGGPYYWRIDEHNNDGTVSKGRVWRFSVADFVPVDDFEGYKGDEVPVTEQIWGKWRDGVGYGAPGIPPYYAGNGTGSEVGDVTTASSYTEESIARNGSAQSMPYWYNNNKPDKFKYSEAKMTLTAPRDWSDEGVKALSLWFQGYPASVGSFTEGPVGTYTMTASGTDIWDVTGLGTGFHDEFHFAYKQLSGAGTIMAKVESVQDTDPWAKAGVMIRDTLDANSVHAMMVVSPSSGVSFQRRPAVGEASASTTEAGIPAPQWVKIERDVGGNMTASYSDDGVSWTQQGIGQINMNTPIYIGLALTSHDAALTCEAVFSNVTVTGAAAQQWSHQDIGIEGNEAQPMYVALANSTGQPAVVYHDDPDASTIDTWTEWNIDLKDFKDQGINLADVNSIAIGFGDRNNPVAGGAGKMYFDDIRLYRPRFFPDKVTLLAGDLNRNGVVDMADIEVMAADWLNQGGDGLWYEYCEGSWSVLPDFGIVATAKQGVINNFDIGVRNQNDNFGFRFSGKINVAAAGDYTFYTTSDDGSQLFIDGALLVDNDGLHGMVEQLGTVTLTAGLHDIAVTMFEVGGGEGLVVEYEGPGIARGPIPDDVLTLPAPVSDLNQDGAVDFEDYAILLDEWGQEVLWPEW